MRCELFERLQRVANAMDGSRLSGGSMMLHEVDFETAAQIWLLGGRPKKWTPREQHHTQAVYYAIDIRIGSILFTLFTVERPPLPYEMPEPAPQAVKVTTPSVVESKSEPEESARFSLLEVN